MTERLDLLRHTLSGLQCRLVVYFRPQNSWLESMYLQSIQHGDDLDAASFLEPQFESPYMRWSNLLDLICDRLPDIEVIPRAYHSGMDAVADFAAATGLDVGAGRTSTSSRTNVTIAAIHAPIVRALNHSHPLGHPPVGVVRQYFQTIPHPPQQRASPFTPIWQERIREEFRADWTLLATKSRNLHSSATDSFDERNSDWRLPILPYPGDSVCDPPVRDEITRLFGILLADEVRNRASFKRSAAAQLAGVSMRARQLMARSHRGSRS